MFSSRPPAVELSQLAQADETVAPVSGVSASELSGELKGADLSERKLRGVDLRERDLEGANLRGADLSDARLQGARLSRACLVGARLRGADLSGSELIGADLSSADLRDCQAEQAGFGHARLVHCNMFGARLAHATFIQADLSSADLRTARLESGRLCGATLHGTDLTRARLAGVDLSGASVEQAVFLEADLRGARLTPLRGYRSASFVRTDIRDVDFSGAYLLRREIMDENYLFEFRSQSRGHAVLYWAWRLTSDCGRSLLRWGLWTALVTVAFGVAFRYVAIDYGDYPTELSPYYYSLVTLTTLGYGDVLPASRAAQVVAMCEVVVGYVMLGGLLSIVANKMARRAE